MCSYWVEVCIAGNYDDIRRECKEFCDRGLCVTVTPTTYVWTNGEQGGAIIRLVQYPRFPKEEAEIWDAAEDLAHELRNAIREDSALIMDRRKVQWISRDG